MVETYCLECGDSHTWTIEDEADGLSNYVASHSEECGGQITIRPVKLKKKKMSDMWLVTYLVRCDTCSFVRTMEAEYSNNDNQAACESLVEMQGKLEKHLIENLEEGHVAVLQASYQGPDDK